MITSLRFGKRCITSFLLVVALSGCDRTTEPAFKKPATTVTVTALVWAPDWPQEMNRVADEFMRRNPGIQVDVQFMIGNSVEANLKPKVASGKLPGIVSINPNAYAAGLAQRGLLVELGQTQAWANMLDMLKGDWTAGGQRHFGIAGGVATTLIYYNKTMFEKAGIRAMPTDFPGFLAACAQLKKAGFVPIAWNGGFPNMLGNGPFSYGFANAVVARHPDWKVRLLDGSLNLGTPEVEEVFSRLKRLPDLGYVQKDYLHTNYDEGIRLFTEGEAAMAFQGTWAAGLLMHGKGFETGILLPPWNMPGRPSIPVISSETGFGVINGPHKAEALKFLEFIYGEGFAIQQNKRQNIPPLKKVTGIMVNNAEVVAFVNQISAAPVTGGLYYAVLPSNTIEMLHPLMHDVLFGTKSPRQAAKALDDSIKTEARSRND